MNNTTTAANSGRFSWGTNSDESIRYYTKELKKMGWSDSRIANFYGITVDKLHAICADVEA